MIKIFYKFIYAKFNIKLNNLDHLTFFLLNILILTSLLAMNNEKLFDKNIVFAYSEITSRDVYNNNENYNVNVSDIPAKKITLGDIDIAYKIFGKGESPLVLISGSANVMDAWPTSFLNELALTHKVIMFDNRGVGNTTIGTQPFTVQQFANDTAKLLDALKIQRADVLGFSMGSFVAQQFTLNHPEKVNKLVLYGSSCGGKDAIPQSPEIVKTISDIVNNRTTDEKMILSLTFPLEWIETNPNYQDNIPKSKEIITLNTVKKQFEAVEDWVATNWNGTCANLQKIKNPTLVISGLNDAVIPSENSLIIAEKIKRSWLVQINGAGHGLMYQYPEQFGGIVKTFFENTKFN
jgi:pimeloyl-ACP methyl ester carboxylesterase